MNYIDKPSQRDTSFSEHKKGLDMFIQVCIMKFPLLTKIRSLRNTNVKGSTRIRKTRSKISFFVGFLMFDPKHY